MLPAVVGALALVAGVVVVKLVPRLSELATYGYLGVFALMVVSGSTVLLPVPGIAGVVTAGMVWNPLIVGLVAGLGSATGEVTGYIAGRSGRTILGVGNKAIWRRAESWIKRFGFPALVAFAAVPNPLFDVVGIVAGCLGFSPWQFWLACAIGNSIKYTAMAFLGGLALTLIQ